MTHYLLQLYHTVSQLSFEGFQSYCGGGEGGGMGGGVKSSIPLICFSGENIPYNPGKVFCGQCTCI